MKLIHGLVFACAAFAAFIHPATAARGDLDLSFKPTVNLDIYELVLQADGKILIRGGFTEVDGIARRGFARLHRDGRLDQGFQPNLGPSNSGVRTMAVQANGKILIAGSFQSVGEIARTNLARLNADGTLDSSFNLVMLADPYPSVGSIVVQTDGKILIGGYFTMVNGVARNALARLNVDGTLDMNFHPLSEAGREPAGVFGMVLQPDGKILVAGRMDGTRFVRLNADGALDTGFNVGVYDDVESWALQADGKILIGGDFSTVGAVERLGLAQLNADGTLDLGFNPPQDYKLSDAIAVQTDGKILIGSYVLGRRLAQLHTSGALDPDFNPNVNKDVYDIAIQADGKILIAGSFTSVSGVSRSYIARLLGQLANEVSLGPISVVNGFPGFDIASTEGRTVVVEASTNLVNWIGIQSLPIASEPVRFNDLAPTNFPSRFYRVSWQP